MDWSNLQKDYERLGSLKAVAAEYGTYPATVSRAAKRLGIATSHSKHIDWSELQELYDSGLNQDEIAEHYGCSASLVSMAMRTLGIQARPSGPTGWTWGDEQHRKRREAVARGAFVGAQRERFRHFGKKSPKENSPSERVLHQALIKAGLSFETQSRELGRYWPDVKLHQQPILLEVDGWAHGMPARKQFDENRDAALTAAGFTVVRFSNEEIDADADGCVQRLTERFGLAREENPAALIRDRRSYE